MNLPELFAAVLLPQDYDYLQDQSFFQDLDINTVPASMKIALAVYLLVYARYRNIDIQPVVGSLAALHPNKKHLEFIGRNIQIESLGISSLDSIFISVSDAVSAFVEKAVHFIQSQPMVTELVPLPGLEVAEYEHPWDAMYLNALKSAKGFDLCFKKIIEYGLEPFLRINATGSLLRVTENMLPEIYAMLKQGCEILDIENIPELYVQQGFINGCTSGDKQPFIILDSGSINVLSHDELMFLIGHELGHVKSRHCLYHMMGEALPLLSSVAQSVTLGLSNVVSLGIEVALKNWQRMSEFTADRAGLLCCQNIDAAYTVFMKLSGLPIRYYGRENIEAFKEQARAFADFDMSVKSKTIKYLSILGQDHPWIIMRGKELTAWIDGGQYEDVLSGKTRIKPVTSQEEFDEVSVAEFALRGFTSLFGKK